MKARRPRFRFSSRNPSHLFGSDRPRFRAFSASDRSRRCELGRGEEKERGRKQCRASEESAGAIFGAGKAAKVRKELSDVLI